MLIDVMLDAFANDETVQYYVIGALDERVPEADRVHIRLTFTGQGEATVSSIDDRHVPELATEAWSIIERDGHDDGMETFLGGVLVGLAASTASPVAVPV